MLLPIGGDEERRIIMLLESWLEETLGIGRREALMSAEESDLAGQELLDWLAMKFLLEIKQRDIAK